MFAEPALQLQKNAEKNMLIRDLWHFFTTLWHIFEVYAICDKIQQSKVGSFHVLRL